MKYNLISFNEAQIIVFELNESFEDLQLQLNLTQKEKKELLNLSSEKRKLEFLGIRISLKILLGEEKKLCYNSDGKPYLSDNTYQISISHSSKWIAIIAHPTQNVGVDIETPNDKILKIHKRFLGAKELNELNNEIDIQKLQLIWSAKEALYKIIGKSAVDFSKQLRVYPFQTEISGELTTEHIPTKSLYRLQYIQTSDYTLVYCLH